MKKTLNVNIGSMAFVLDEDAYYMLRRYLDDVEARFEPNEAAETLNDLEMRIADIFTEELSSPRQVVDVEMVRKAISILGRADEIRLDVMPSAVFSNPEAAAVGLTEAQCREAGMEYTARKTPFRANGRAVADEADGGLIKLITNNDGTIIGCHVCGSHAADIVQEASALMSLGCKADRLHDITHIHPTIAELLRDSVEN